MRRRFSFFWAQYGRGILFRRMEDKTVAKIYEELDNRLRAFIANQKMFFVGSAPCSDQGMINISPKGMGSFRILDSKTVAYLDYTGSGIESVAHIKENGRFVVMFCSFEKTPMILRLHGQACVIERSNLEWKILSSHFPESKMARSIIKLPISRIADSCGWGVPMYDYVGERKQYHEYSNQITDEGLRQAQLDSNMRSIEGLVGLEKPSL